VPTNGGRYGARCIQDQRIDRPDVVSFRSEPLPERLDVTGRISASLWVSSDRPDTDFVVKMVDVFPTGYAMNVAEGQLRLRYRDGFTSSAPIEPGKVYSISIDLGWTSHLFGASHRIRLDVTSSNFPKLEPNPNTGQFQDSVSAPLKARNSIYHSRRYPSRLLLSAVVR
jgi:putative CocE/NonD family hydrolase